jgi:putative hydrolase of the HAD superfamily
MILSGAIYNGKTKIKNIIFDWGGVITDLHFDRAKKAFTDLGLHIFDESVPHDPNDDLFIPFEVGKITPQQFRDRVKTMTANPVTNEMIDNAWNSLLGELPEERWKILQEVRKNYRTFLLSNTNGIHLPFYSNYIREKYGVDGYESVFEKTYYSYELQLRKPNADIFNYLIKDAGINPAESLFIDDFIENIDTAKLLGFQTIQMKKPLSLTDVFIS